jgi:hypothetical protein
MDDKMYHAIRVVVDHVKMTAKYAKGSQMDKAIRLLDAAHHAYAMAADTQRRRIFSSSWLQTTVMDAFEEYREGLGTKHPERLITLDAFERRICEFEAVVFDWMDNDKKWAQSTLARRWGNACGMATWDCIPMFARMWKVVDSRFPIT